MIKDAVIPVAGLGTRLLPATRSQPKEMLPVLDKPIVQYVVEELARAGIERVLFVTGRRERAIEDHFDAEDEASAPGAGMEFLYTRQPRPAGLGEALTRAGSFAGEHPVVVALGDAIIEPPPGAEPGAGIVARLIEAYERTGASAAIAVDEVPSASVSRYGIVVPADGPRTDDSFELATVLEKPDPIETSSRLGVMARYVLGPTVFAELRRTAPESRSGEAQGSRRPAGPARPRGARRCGAAGDRGAPPRHRHGRELLLDVPALRVDRSAVRRRAARASRDPAQTAVTRAEPPAYASAPLWYGR